MRKHLFCSFALLMLVGCAGPASMSSWKTSVDRYVANQGRGDPNVLRDVTWPQSRRTFSTIGGEDPAVSQDAKGLLVSVSQVNGKPWFVFIVGIVKNQAVQDISIAAMNSQGNNHTWKTSSSNPKALQTYRDYNEKLWKQRFPGRQSAPAQYTTFPQESDAFGVRVEGGKIIVTHAASSAQWELVVDH